MPDRSYVVLATPRTGSSLLCSLLLSTGIAGRPTEYYFPRAQVNLSMLWGIADPKDYGERVLKEGTTPNGVFGLKLMFSYLDEVLNRERQLSGSEQLNDLQLISRLAPRPQFVWMYRDDVVAQGVSWAKAYITNEWVVGDVRKWTDEAAFDFGLVHEFVWRATRLQFLARRWFAYYGIQPFLVSYDHLRADPDGVVRGLLDYLGLPAPKAPLATHMEPQTDRRNLEWATRYRALARQLPAGFPALTDPIPAELAPLGPPANVLAAQF